MKPHPRAAKTPPRSRGIENNSETIAKAFETSLDSLYAGEALDISSDIDVLNGMVNAKTSMFE